MVGFFYMLERSHLPTVYLFLSRLFALTKQLRPTLYLAGGCNYLQSRSANGSQKRYRSAKS